MSTYYELWDQYEKEGRLIDYETPYGTMVDNLEILTETRLRVKLVNPNHSTD